MKFTVGQKLWMVLFDYYDEHMAGQEVVITKVNRRYLVINYRNSKVEKSTLRIAGGVYGTIAQCYLSKEDHEKAVELRDTWKVFCQRMRSWRMPEGVTVEDIREAMKLLKLEE